jgi:drug/metabolite transporter (DMT)-like permease
LDIYKPFAGYNAEVKENSHGELRSYAALGIGVVAITWSAIFVRWAAMPGPASAFYRVLFAFILLSPLAFRKIPSVPRASFLWAAAGGVFFAGDLALFNSAVMKTTATSATLLAYISPVIVGLLAWAISRRAPRPVFWVGLLVSVVGSALVAGSDLLHHASLGLGDMMACCASACFAGYLLVTEHARRSMPATLLLGGSLAATAVSLFVFSLAAGISLKIPNAHSLLALLGLGIVCQLLGYLSLTYALGHLPATVTSVTLLLQVPLTAVLAIMLLHEQLSWQQAAGGLLVLVGVGVVNRFGRNPVEV